MSMDTLLLIGALVLLIAVMAAKFGDRFGLPALLLFLGLGVLIGAPWQGTLFNDAQLAHDLGFAALVLILAEGGLTTRWSDIRPALWPAVSLATVGIVIVIAAMTTFGILVLGLPAAVAVLLAAAMAPTDSAAVFAVLRGLPLPQRIKATLEGESGLNDAPTVLLVTAATGLAMGELQYGDLPRVGLIIAAELVGGVMLGLLFGWIGVRLLRNLALPSSGLYPLATLGWAVISYGAGTVIHVSGFAAVYVCSVYLANGKLPHRHAIRSFAQGIGWIAQIGLFVMLGLLANLTRLNWGIIGAATVAGLFLTFVARPLSVWISLAPFRRPWREQVFISWAGLRGAVPIILATIPLAAGLNSSAMVFDLIFVAVIVLTILNAPSLPWVARRLGLATETGDVDIEVAPLDKVDADMVQMRVTEDSRLHGVAVSELRLPANAVVTLVIRGDRTFTPSGRDVLHSGDEVLIVTPSSARATVEDRLRSVDRGGRLAGWFNERQR